LKRERYKGTLEKGVAGKQLFGFKKQRGGSRWESKKEIKKGEDESHSPIAGGKTGPGGLRDAPLSTVLIMAY